MPAHVCIICRVVYIAGTLPASHGICAPCLLAEDPDAAEELAAEMRLSARPIVQQHERRAENRPAEQPEAERAEELEEHHGGVSR